MGAIQRIGVIGAGQMGSGIAHVCALAGFDVKLNDVSPDRIKAGIATINGNLARQVRKKVISEDDRQAALKRMVERGRGALFFTGASASVKGYAESAPFAMAKFALRGLAQSLAREFGPKNIHVAHFVIDGGIGRANDPRAAARGEDGMLDPDAIAQAYMDVYRQHRSAWAFEVDLRPWVEKF